MREVAANKMPLQILSEVVHEKIAASVYQGAPAAFWH